ncbi:hypothetical protein [Ornithinimicrobium kibberense]
MYMSSGVRCRPTSSSATGLKSEWSTATRSSISVTRSVSTEKTSAGTRWS